MSQHSFLGAGSTLVAPPGDDDPVFVCTAGVDCVASRTYTGPWIGWKGTAADFGHRHDGRRNKRCPSCRANTARQGGIKYGDVRKERKIPRDVKALRVVERWSGFPYAEWKTPAVMKWQWDRRIWLEDIWTDRMRRLAEREARVTARIAAARAKPATAGAAA